MERWTGKAVRWEASEEEAPRLWTALLSGEWSIVDRQDSDGKCVLLALRNHPGQDPSRALSEREKEAAELAARGLSNKQIGSMLGISPSRVAAHLHAALAKLRLESCRELILLLGSRAPDPRT